MKKIVVVMVLLVLMGVGVFGQGNWGWARQGGGYTGSDAGWSIATDNSGNIIATGSFQDSTITFGAVTLTNTGGENTFIVKYDANANVIWAKRSIGISLARPMSITTDATGNIYVIGFFDSPMLLFDTCVLTNLGNTDMFIVKYSSSGIVLWAKRVGGSYADFGYSIASDFQENIYITGGFWSSTVAFDSITLTSNVGERVFLAKMDSNGNFVWAKSSTGPGEGEGRSVTCDKLGNIYLTGGYELNSIIFGNDTLTNAGNLDIFIAKYNANGNKLWAKGIGGNNYDEGYSVATDSYGNAYVTGYFYSPILIFGSLQLNRIFGNDMFVAKYNSIGNALWVRKAGGSGDDYGFSVATDDSGVYVTGSSSGSFIIISTSDTLRDPAGINVLTDPLFIIKYDSIGNVICGTELSSGGDTWTSVATDALGNAYVVGSFFINPFIVGADSLLLGNGPFFIAKYNCNTSHDGITQLPTHPPITLYPNPTTNNFTIAFGSITKKVVLTITDITGKLLYTATAAETEKMNVTTSSFAEGMYLVKIQTDEGVETRKLIVEK